jgi:hypothetical protein
LVQALFNGIYATEAPSFGKEDEGFSADASIRIVLSKRHNERSVSSVNTTDAGIDGRCKPTPPKKLKDISLPAIDLGVV